MILERENLDRMRQGDPLDFLPRTLRQQIRTDRPIRDLDLVIAYEEDVGTIIAFREQDDIAGLMKWLERGRVHRPGDAQPPLPLRRT